MDFDYQIDFEIATSPFSPHRGCDLTTPTSKLIRLEKSDMDSVDLQSTADEESIVQSSTFEFSKAEKSVRKFLIDNPKIEQRRQERIKTNQKRLLELTIEDVKYIVNLSGLISKLVKFSSEDDYLMIKPDFTGQQIASHGIDSSWFHINRSIVSNGIKAASVLTCNPHRLMMSLTALSNIAIMSGSGAIGCFIFRLVSGKMSLKESCKEFITNTTNSITINLIMSTIPYVAMSVAWVVSFKVMVDLASNKFVSKAKKAKLACSIIGRTGAGMSIAVCSALLGQVLVPVPLLGSFVGGVIGGFAVTAIFTAYGGLMAKKVSLETLFLYCMMRLSKHGIWTDAFITDSTLDFYRDSLLTFFKTISEFLEIEINIGLFH